MELWQSPYWGHCLTPYTDVMLAQAAHLCYPVADMRMPNAYRQAYEAQEIVMARMRDPLCPTSVIPQLSKALTELEEMKRKLKMRPLPKAVDVSVTLDNLRRLPSALWTEPPKESLSEAEPSPPSATGEGFLGGSV